MNLDYKTPKFIFCKKSCRFRRTLWGISKKVVDFIALCGVFQKKCKFYRSSLKERQNSDFTESIHSVKTN